MGNVDIVDHFDQLLWSGLQIESGYVPRPLQITPPPFDVMCSPLVVVIRKPIHNVILILKLGLYFQINTAESKQIINNIHRKCLNECRHF